MDATKTKDMNAKEYIENEKSKLGMYGCFADGSISLSEKQVIQLMESYHQHKLSEITEEKIMEVIKSFEREENIPQGDGHYYSMHIIQNGYYAKLSKAILNLLKEQG